MNILFNTLTPEQKEKVIRRNLRKNETLFYEDEYCHSVCIVIKGMIKIASYDYKGNEIIYNHISDNGIFGNNLLFSKEPYYKGNIIAVKETELLMIYKEELLNFLKENRDFLIHYLQIQSDFGKDLNDRIKLLSTDNAKDRLILFLNQNNGFINYHSITSLASQLSLQRETLSRLLNRLQKEKIITKKGKTISLSSSYIT